MTGQDAGVSWQAMITYVEDRMRSYAEVVQQTATALRAHEREHQERLANTAQLARAGRATWALVLVGAASCVGSLILDVITLTGR